MIETTSTVISLLSPSRGIWENTIWNSRRRKRKMIYPKCVEVEIDDDDKHNIMYCVEIVPSSSFSLSPSSHFFGHVVNGNQIHYDENNSSDTNTRSLTAAADSRTLLTTTAAPPAIKSTATTTTTPTVKNSTTKNLLPVLLSRLQRYTTIASWLCLIDCIVFPIVTLIIPLLGIFNSNAAGAGAGGGHGHHGDTEKWIHDASHVATLLFLIPVGFLSTCINYISHRRLQIVSLSVFGLVLVGIANSYTATHHWERMHVLHNGIWHRLVNVCGCFCLLLSNHWSHHVITLMRTSRRQRRRHQQQQQQQGNKEISNDDDDCCVFHSSNRHPKIMSHPLKSPNNQLETAVNRQCDNRSRRRRGEFKENKEPKKTMTDVHLV
jgi:MerC mercury resistance protein